MEFNAENFKVFENEQLANLPSKEQFHLFGVASYILYCALDEYDRTGNEEDAMFYLSKAAHIFGGLDCKAFNSLYTSVMQYICFWKSKKTINEFYYQDLFKKHCSSLISGSKIAKIKTDRRNIPDAFVLLAENETPVPVEVKLNNFNVSALRQLSRYMEVYNSNKGIAVGRELTVELPKNISFFSLYQLEELESKSSKD